ELGTVLLFRIIDEMCRQGVKRIRMGGGDYFYKRQLANIEDAEATILVFASSIRGITLSLLRLVTLAPIDAGRRLARGLGLERYVKLYWRRFLQRERT